MAKTTNIGNIFRSIKNSKYLELFPDFRKEKAQRSASLFLSLIALSFLGLFAINPTLSTIAKLRKELADNKFVDQKLQEKINNLSALQQKYSLMQTDVPVVLDSIPQDPEVPLLLGQIQSIAKNSNVTFNNLQSFQVEAVSSSTNQNKYSSFSFSASLQGSYNDLIKFLSTLVNMQRVISIETISINKKGDQAGVLQIDILGKAYFKK
ncbi:MAG: type 4a pilus biogenesis protein PilO [Patescibacteria group bacterium]|nr:type 4a pilus biogenesis protein PilO [Patescibacteria group bacterium]